MVHSWYNNIFEVTGNHGALREYIAHKPCLLPGQALLSIKPMKLVLVGARIFLIFVPWGKRSSLPLADW